MAPATAGETPATPYEGAACALFGAEREGLKPLGWRLPCHMVPRFLMARDNDGQELLRYPGPGPEMTMMGLPVEVVRPASPDAGLALICQGEAHG